MEDKDNLLNSGKLSVGGNINIDSALLKSEEEQKTAKSDPFSPSNTGLPVIIYGSDGKRIGNVWSPSKNNLGTAISNVEKGAATKIYFDSKTGEFTNYPSSSMTYKNGKITFNVASDVSKSDWYKKIVESDEFQQLASLYKLDPTGKTELEVTEKDDDGKEVKSKKTINDLLQGYADLIKENSKKYQSNIDIRTDMNRATKGALELTDDDLVYMMNHTNFSKDNYGNSDVIFLPNSIRDYFKDYETYDEESGSISADTFYKNFYHLNSELPESAREIIDILGGGELGDSTEALKQVRESDKDYAIDLIRLKVSQEMVDIVERISFYKEDMSTEEKAALTTEYAKCYSLYKTMIKDTPNTDSWTGFNMSVQALSEGIAMGTITAAEGMENLLSKVVYVAVDGGVRAAAAIEAPFSWLGELLGNFFSGGWDKMTQETRKMYEHFDEWYTQNSGEGSVLAELKDSIKSVSESIDNGENVKFVFKEGWDANGKILATSDLVGNARDLALSYANTEAMVRIGQVSGLILTQIVMTNPIGQAVGGLAQWGIAEGISMAGAGVRLATLLKMANVYATLATNASTAAIATKYLNLINLISKVGTGAGFAANMFAQGVVDTFVENPSLTDALLFNEDDKNISEFQNAIRWNIAFNVFGEFVPFAGKGVRKGMKFVATNTKWGAVTQALLRKGINRITLRGRKIYEGIAEFMTRKMPEEIIEQTDATSTSTKKLNQMKRWQAMRKEIIAKQEEIKEAKIFRGEGSWSEKAKVIDDLVQERIDLETKLGLSKKIAIAEAKNKIIKNAGLEIDVADLAEQTADLTMLSKKMKQTNLPGSFSKETGDYINDLYNRQLLEAKEAALLGKGKLLSNEEQAAFDILKKRITDYESTLPSEYAAAYKDAVRNFLEASYRFYDKLNAFLASDEGGNIISKKELERMRAGFYGARYMHQYAVSGFSGAKTIEDLLNNPGRVVEQGKIKVEDVRFNKKMFSDEVTYFDPNYTREMVLSHYANISNGITNAEAVIRAGRATSIETDWTGKILKTPDDIARAKKNMYKDFEKQFGFMLRESDGLGTTTAAATEKNIKKFWSRTKRSAQRKVNDILGLNKKGLVSFASTMNSKQIHQISTVYSMPRYSARIKTRADLQAMYNSLSPAQKEIVNNKIPGFSGYTAEDIKTGKVNAKTRTKLAQNIADESNGEKFVLWRTQSTGVDDYYGSAGGGGAINDAERARWKGGRWASIGGNTWDIIGYGDQQLVFPVKKADILDTYTIDEYKETAHELFVMKYGSASKKELYKKTYEQLGKSVKDLPHYAEISKLKKAALKKIADGDPRALLDISNTKIIQYDAPGSGRQYVLFPDRNPELLEEGINEMAESSAAAQNMIRKWNNAVLNDNLDVELSRQYIAENSAILNSNVYKGIVAEARERSLTEEEALALKDSRLKIEEADKEILAGEAGTKKAAKQLKGELKKTVRRSVTESVDAMAEALMASDNQYLNMLVKEFEKAGVPEDLARKYIIYQWMYDNIGENGVIQHIAFDYYGDYSKVTGINASKDAARGYSKNFRDAADSVVQSKLNKTIAQVQEAAGENANALIDMESTVARTEKYLKDISDMYGRHEIIEAWDRKTGQFIYYKVDRSTYNLVTNYPTFQKNNVVTRTLARLNAIARIGQITLRMASLVTQGFKDSLNAIILGGWDQIMLDNPDAYKKIAEYISEDVVEAFRKEMTPSAWQDFLAKASWEQGVSLSEVNIKEAIAKAEINNDLLETKIKGVGTSSSYFSLKGLYESAEGDVAADTWAKNKTKWQAAYDKASETLRKISQKRDSIIDSVSNRVNYLHNLREENLRKQVYRQNFMDALAMGKSLNQARSYAQYFMENATTNFSRGVAWGAQIVRSIPYFGAMLNGASSMIRLLEVDPLGVMMRFTTDLVVPTVGLTVLSLQNETDAEIYRNIPEWDKKGNLIWVVNGQVETVPLPEEMAKFILPIRHAVELMSGANKNAWHELLLNDILNLPTIPLDAVMMLDDKKISGDPSVLDRISALALDMFNTLAPNSARTAYIATTGRDPYTGKEYGRMRLFEDENGEYQYMSVSEYDFLQDMSTLFKGWGWEISPLFAEGLLSSIFGTGSLDLMEGVRDFIASAQQGEANMVALLEPSMERAGGVLTGTTRTDEKQAQIAWYSLLNELKPQKNELLSPTGKLAQYAKDIDMASNAEEKAKKVELYNAEVRNWQNKVLEKVKWYNSVYGDYFDRYKFASTISYMTTQMSIDNIKDSTAYYSARSEAVKTMYDAGFTSPNDNSIFGYAYRNPQSGEVKFKYTDPLIISLNQNLLWYQGDTALRQIEEAIEFSGLKDRYNEEFYPAYSEAMKNKDYTKASKLAADWDVQVIKEIMPIIDEYNVSDLLNKSSVIDYLDNYIKVPSTTDGMGRGKYYSSKTGLNKQRGFAQSYIKKIYNRLKEEK